MTISTIEGFEKGKSGMHPVKMRWDKKLRNIILILLIPFDTLLGKEEHDDNLSCRRKAL